MASRRAFLTGTAGALFFLNETSQLPRPAFAKRAVQADWVRLSADIEPVVQIIEQTPRKECLPRVASLLREGLTYRQLVAALYLAGIRNVNPQPPGFKFHCVFVIHACHQASLEAQHDQQFLPLFWALDNFKVSQQQDVEQGDFSLKAFRGRTLSPSDAYRELDVAMEAWDEERADRAIVSLVRGVGAQQISEALWAYGARDYRNIGHKAIFVANTWRTLQTIGWRHAEPALRSLILGLLDFGASERVNAFAFDDQCYRPNVELLASRFQELPDDWTHPRSDQSGTSELLETLRHEKPSDVSSAAFELLAGGKVGAPELWDAAHLAAGELMMRQPGIYGIHTVTSVNALRYAYEQAASSQTRALMLLQAVGWMSQFRLFMQAKQQGLNDRRITSIPAFDNPPSAEAVLTSSGTDVEHAAAAAASFVRSGHAVEPLLQGVNRLLLRKASDAHHFKYASAILEDFRRVSPVWRPQMLATATYYLPGERTGDSPVLAQAVDLLKQN